MAGIADMLISGYDAGNQLRVQREAEQKRRGLASLYQQAYQAPVADQQGLVAQAAGIDPQAGMQLQGALGKSNQDQAHRLVGMAQALTQTPEEMRPQMYAAMLPELKRMGIPVSDQYDPSVMQVAQQVLQKVYGADAEQFTLSPGSRRYDASGKVIAEVPFAPTRDNWDVVNVPDGNGGTVQMEHNATTGAWRQPSYAGAPTTGGGGQVMSDALTSAMIGVESGGNPNAVSPAGARGLMQVMPATARDPGFGVQPMQGNSPQENVRFGQDYMQAMLAKYGGNQQLALMAYNGGPGRVDAALQKAGGDPQRAMQYLPQETQQYPGKVQARLGYNPPKTNEYKTLTPAEVKALGLPEGTVAQRSPEGQVQIVNKPRDLPAGGQMIDNGDGTTTYIPAGRVSDASRNAAGFYQRMVEADKELSALEGKGYDPTNLRDYTTVGGKVLNALSSPEGQQYHQAAQNWVRANLRKESGAAIGVAEMAQEIRNYFPQFGDGPEVIAQKAHNRKVVEDAMRQAAAGALPPRTGGAPKADGWKVEVIQ